jgi:hypothetical protein
LLKPKPLLIFVDTHRRSCSFRVVPLSHNNRGRVISQLVRHPICKVSYSFLFTRYSFNPSRSSNAKLFADHSRGEVLRFIWRLLLSLSIGRARGDYSSKEVGSVSEASTIDWTPWGQRSINGRRLYCGLSSGEDCTKTTKGIAQR